MTTIEIYKRVLYDPNYHTYMCKWDKRAWFFTDEKSYGELCNYLENVIDDYLCLLNTINLATEPRVVEDIFHTVYIHMPELFI